MKQLLSGRGLAALEVGIEHNFESGFPAFQLKKQFLEASAINWQNPGGLIDTFVLQGPVPGL